MSNKPAPKPAPNNLPKLAKINWKEIARNLPVYFGLSSTERKKNMESKVSELAGEETGYATPITDYLSYRYFDKEKELFFNDGGFIGFMMEIAPIVGVDEGMLKNLHFFFNNDKELPEGSFIQFLLIADHNVEGVLGKWQELRINKHPVIQKLTKKRADFIRKLSANFVGRDGRIARDYRIYVSFSKKMELFGGNLEKMQNLKKLLADKLSVLGLHYRVCAAEDLIQVCRTLVQMEIPDGNEKVSYDPAVLLSDQVLRPLRPIIAGVSEIAHERSGLVSKSFHTKKLPREFSLHQMIGLLGSSQNNALGIGARFVISYTIAADLSESKQKAINVSGQRVIDEADKWHSINNRDIAREAAEWREAIDSNINNERYLNEAFSVMITVPRDQMSGAEQSLTALYNTLDFQLEVNQNLQLVAMLAILPMQQGLYWQILKRFKLTGTCLAAAAVARLPIHAEWKGVPMSGVLLQSRRGQLFNWNPFYQIGGNYNVCVFGPSGGGKSVLLQELVKTLDSQNIQSFVLDIGQSFANICKLFDGEMIQFDKKANLSLNPFRSFFAGMDVEDFKEMLKCAKALISIMCGIKKQDTYSQAELEKAIGKALIEHNYKLDITEFAEFLQDSDSAVWQRLGVSLYPYTRDGIYGKYFTGEKKASFNSLITVFEFEEIKNDPSLLAIVLQILLMEITNKFLMGDRSKKFIIVVDEAWMLLDFAASFFAVFVRTVRKYGGSLVICVQNFMDLQKTENHRTILANSTWTIMLKQDEKGLEAFKSSEAFKDMLPLISSISLSPGKYSEMLIYTTGIKVIGRLVLDNYSKALYSTNAVDFSYIKAATNNGQALDAVVEELAIRKYGEEI